MISCNINVGYARVFEKDYGTSSCKEQAQGCVLKFEKRFRWDIHMKQIGEDHETLRREAGISCSVQFCNHVASQATLPFPAEYDGKRQQMFTLKQNKNDDRR